MPDFRHGEVDLIDLSAFRPTRFLDAQVAGAADVGANEAGWYYDAATNRTSVLVDTDGIAGADLTINLTGVTSVQASDFIF